LFDTLLEVKVPIERWRVEDITISPHSSLDYRPPAPEAIRTMVRIGKTELAEKESPQEDAMPTQP